MMRFTFFHLLIAVLSNCAGSAYAEKGQQPADLTVEMRIYQVMTSLTGYGNSSRTLPGDEGSFQILHVKLDDVELDMDGRTLTWDGEPSPSHHAIRLLANPTIIPVEGQKSGIHIQTNEPVEYLDRREDGLFELKTIQAKEPNPLGCDISFIITRSQQSTTDPVLEIDMKFSYTWIRGRERIEGVNLNIGKPIIGTKALDCFFGTRSNDWVCYRTAIRSQGSIYIFMRIADGRIPGSGKDWVK